jgi:hypothetical protein
MILKILFWVLLLLGSAALNYAFINKLPLLAAFAGILFAGAIHLG